MNPLLLLWDSILLQMDLLIKLLFMLAMCLLIEVALLAFLLSFIYASLSMIIGLAQCNTDKSRVAVGFFHPYSAAGGGGERVLWHAVKALQEKYPHVDCVIYSGPPFMTNEELSEHIRERFNIILPRSVTFVPLTTRKLLNAQTYPRFTLILQALGSMLVGIEALMKYKPDVFVDTMGYSFVYPVIKVLTNCKVGCYIHYPVISTDMLEVVEQGTVAHNNVGIIANSPMLTSLKSYYYKAFSIIYGWVGRRADVVMVNSSWTEGHIASLWNVPEKTSLVFPPCDISKLEALDIIPYDEKPLKKIMSIGQFRPEKDHALQLRSFKKLLELLSNRGGNVDALEVQLVIVGGVRDSEDEQRLSNLQDLAKTLGIDKQVEFKANLPYNDMLDLMQESCTGLHTMWNEHFGICVVEMQASGLITVAHASGGPKMDIVVPYEDRLTGLLASNVESYAESLHTSLTMCDQDREDMQRAARANARRFNAVQFEQSFARVIGNIIPSV